MPSPKGDHPGIAVSSEQAAPDRHSLAPILDPRSIAVVGASANPAKRGHQILLALGEAAFQGPVYPVHPTEGTILGRRVYPSVAALPEPADLAVICTPGETTPGLIRECGERGIAGAIVLAVGMSDPGPFGTGQLEEELAAAASESGVRLVGPNTSGIANFRTGANLIGATGIRPGDLAVLVQSGNVALSLMKQATERSWSGISSCIGIGNQVDVGFAEAIDYFGWDEDTKGVIAYLEGLPDPPDFLERLARVTRTKPVVVAKGGRTEKGLWAAISHTGSVSGPYQRLAAGLRQAGATVVERSDELFSVAETLAHQPPPATGTGIAVLSDGGGQGTLGVDALSDLGAQLATFSDGTVPALRDLLGWNAALANPVDMAGAADADPMVFARAMEVLCTDSAVGTVLLVGLFGGYGVRFSDTMTDTEVAAAREMADIAQRTGRAFVVHTMYANARTTPLEALGTRGVPVIGSLEIACRCATELHRRRETLDRPVWQPTMERPPVRDEEEPYARTSEWDVRKIFEKAGIPTTPGELVKSAADAEAATERMGGRVALKVCHWLISHKASAGGVELNVTAENAGAAFDRIAEAGRPYLAGIVPESELAVLVTPMAEPGAVELLVGVVREPGLGPVLVVGSGGRWVEVDEDVAHRVLPVDDEEIRDALMETRAGQRIATWGELGPGAFDPVVDVAQKLAALAISRTDIIEAEINPLFVYADEVIAIDARASLSR